MKRHQKFTALHVALLVPVLSMPSTSHAASERYQMTPTENGIMRLDTETGAVSVCQNQSGKASCKMAEDSTRRYTQEIDALKKENQRLRSDIERLEQHFGLGSDTKKNAPNDLTPPVPPSSRFKVPKKEDVDQMFDYIEGMLNKFRERLRRLETEPKTETPL